MGFLDKKKAPTLSAVLTAEVKPVVEIKKSLLGKGVMTQTQQVSAPTGSNVVDAPVPAKIESVAPSAETQSKPEPKGLLASAVARGQEKADAAAEDVHFLFAEEPKDFADILKRFDELLHRDHGLNADPSIDDFNIDTCRNYIKRIYTELQTQPELEGLMVTRDVANVISFIRSIRGRAEEAGVKKTVKAVAKKGEVAKKNRFGDAGLTLDLNSIEDLANSSGEDEWKI